MPVPLVQAAALAAVVASLSGGCGVLSIQPSATVAALASASGIVVANRTGHVIDVFAIEEGAMALWDPPQCMSGSPVPAGETLTLPWSAVYQPNGAKTRYRMFWWRDGTCSFSASPDGGELAVNR